MKKYFMKGTDDELQFGDVIELDFVGEEDGKTKHTHLEVEFMPEVVDDLLEQEVIEVSGDEDEEEEKELIDFDSEESEILEELDDRMTDLEGRVAELEEGLRLITEECLSRTKQLIQSVDKAIGKSEKKTAKKK